MNFLKNIFAQKDAPIQSYSDFWNWFQRNEKVFFKAVKEQRNIEQVFFDALSPKLSELKDGFYFLTGIMPSGDVELIITADGVVQNIVFVEELVNEAPVIDGWVFTALKPAMDIKDLSIQMGGFQFNDKNISFFANEHVNMPDEIDLTIVHDDLNSKNRTTIINGTYLFLDNLLGELNFVTTIDHIDFIEKKEVDAELIPIEKLTDFLIWRQKEFIEKYEGFRYNTENDSFSLFEGELENGNASIAVINTVLLEWDCKASHPWILNININYDGANNNGMPCNEDYILMGEIEDEILEELKDIDGYLNIGRQTEVGVRSIFIACRDFRKPSLVLNRTVQKYLKRMDIAYNIYKDKYWQSVGLVR